MLVTVTDLADSVLVIVLVSVERFVFVSVLVIFDAESVVVAVAVVVFNEVCTLVVELTLVTVSVSLRTWVTTRSTGWNSGTWRTCCVTVVVGSSPVKGMVKILRLRGEHVLEVDCDCD